MGSCCTSQPIFSNWPTGSKGKNLVFLDATLHNCWWLGVAAWKLTKSLHRGQRDHSDVGDWSEHNNDCIAEVRENAKKVAFLRTFCRDKLCFVPKDHPIWIRLGMNPNHSSKMEDPGECWVGQGWGECKPSLGMMFEPEYSPCYWWHAKMPSKVLSQVVGDDRNNSIYRWDHFKMLMDPHMLLLIYRSGDNVIF